MSGNELYQLLTDTKGNQSKEIKKIAKLSSRKKLHSFSIWYRSRYWMGAAAFLCMCVLILQSLFSTLLTSDAIIAKGGPCFQMVVGNEIIPLSVSRSFKLTYDPQIGLNALYKEYDSLDQVNALIGEELLLPKEGTWQLSSDPIYVGEGIGQNIKIRAEFVNELNQLVTVEALLQSDRWSNQEHSILVGEDDQNFCYLIDQYVWDEQDTSIYIATYDGANGVVFYTMFFAWNDMIYLLHSTELNTLYQFLTMF